MEIKGKKDEFILSIGGIGIGNYKFTMTCDKEFFEISGISELQDGTIVLQLDIEKKENMLDVSFHFSGKVEVACSRCLDPVILDLDWQDRLIVKMLPRAKEMLDDVVWVIDEDANELNLFHFVYESIKLALPLQITHADDENGNSTCNSEMIKKLENLATKEAAGTDPRWDALKNIK